MQRTVAPLLMRRKFCNGINVYQIAENKLSLNVISVKRRERRGISLPINSISSPRRAIRFPLGALLFEGFCTELDFPVFAPRRQSCRATKIRKRSVRGAKKRGDVPLRTVDGLTTLTRPRGAGVGVGVHKVPDTLKAYATSLNTKVTHNGSGRRSRRESTASLEGWPVSVITGVGR